MANELRIEPGRETIVGKPLYVVVDRDDAGRESDSVEFAEVDGREVVKIPFYEDGRFLKAELVAFRPGQYRVRAFEGTALITVHESAAIPFLQEFSWTVGAVALAFAVGAVLGRRAGKDH